MPAYVVAELGLALQSAYVIAVTVKLELDSIRSRLGRPAYVIAVAVTVKLELDLQSPERPSTLLLSR